MTVSTSTSAVVEQGNGSTTVWPYTFLIPNANYVQVIVTDSNNNQTFLSPNSYSITGIGNPSGGAVTYPLTGSQLASGYSLTIERILPLQQLSSITNQGGFFPAVYEAALDYLTMICQQLQTAVGQCMSVPIGTNLTPSTYISTVLNAVTTTTANASSAAASAASASASAAAAAMFVPSLYLLKGNNLSDVANVAAARAALGAQATLGYTAANDANVVHLTGNESIAGTKTFGSAPVFASAPAVTAAQSMVRVGTSNGNGSTNTAIRRYTTVLTNQGSDITYTDSATLGGLFTINTPGTYAITVRANSAASLEFGISLNSSQLSTSVSSVNSVDCLDYINGNNITLACGWTGYLPAGSLIRSHDSAGGGHTVSAPAAEQFTITRVS